MFCGWGIEAGWLIAHVDVLREQIKLSDPVITRHTERIVLSPTQ